MPFHASRGGGSSRGWGFNISAGPTRTPTGLGATVNSSAQITLSWTNTLTTFSIRIYRNNTLINTVAKGSTSYTDGGLSGNTGYYYRVAYYGGGTEKATANSSTYTTCYNYGTYTNQACDGYTLYNVCANGNCGSYNCGNVESNSATCGYGTVSYAAWVDGCGDSYMCLEGPCGHQENDDAFNGLSSCIGCTSGHDCATIFVSSCCGNGCGGGGCSGCTVGAGSGCGSGDIFSSCCYNAGAQIGFCY